MKKTNIVFAATACALALLGRAQAHAGGTDTGGFSTLLTTIGFAFPYPGDAALANYIGIDTVSVTALPEPSAWIMLALGLATLSLLHPKSRT